jgi:hypothetical protein
MTADPSQTSRRETGAAWLPAQARQAAIDVLLRIGGPLLYEQVQFRQRVGHFPRLRNPQTINEKIASRKLFADLPMAATLSDKVAVRQYVSRAVGDSYLNEVLLVADSAKDIDFDALPNAFALRPSHGSGLNVIVPDKAAIDVAVTRAKLAGALSRPFGRETNEWWYRQIRPRILVETFHEDERFGSAREYTFFVFHGKARFVRLVRSRPVFDADWNLQDFYYDDFEPAQPIEAPARLGEMREVAEALAAGFDFLRVDLYCVRDERVVFGELTFAPGAGWNQLRPKAGALYMGSFWDIPWPTRELRPEVVAVARGA